MVHLLSKPDFNKCSSDALIITLTLPVGRKTRVVLVKNFPTVYLIVSTAARILFYGSPLASNFNFYRDSFILIRVCLRVWDATYLIKFLSNLLKNFFLIFCDFLYYYTTASRLPQVFTFPYFIHFCLSFLMFSISLVVSAFLMVN